MYLPELRSTSAWTTFNQYKDDNKFYYIKNKDASMAIPKYQSLSFFVYSGNKWKEAYKTTAVYDISNTSTASSSKANNSKPSINASSTKTTNKANDLKSSTDASSTKTINKKTVNNSSSSNNIFANSNAKFQYNPNVGIVPTVRPSGKFQYQEPPKVKKGTFKYDPNTGVGSNKKSSSTSWTNSDGSITTITRNVCSHCNGSKICPMCKGAKQQFYGRTNMLYICKACGGSGNCSNCFGSGYTELRSTYKNGAAIGSDNKGRVYLGPSVKTNDKDRRKTDKPKKREYMDKIVYETNTTGKQQAKVWCERCKDYMFKHRHINVPIK